MVHPEGLEPSIMVPKTIVISTSPWAREFDDYLISVVFSHEFVKYIIDFVDPCVFLLPFYDIQGFTLLFITLRRNFE